MADADFTIADVLAWARTKPADETYIYTATCGCAIAQFLQATGHGISVGGENYTVSLGDRRPLPEGVNKAALRAQNFGEFVTNLEKLCLETIVPPAEWTRLDAYMIDIELASA